jgi:hypothetical protein
LTGACGSVYGWGAKLQATRSRFESPWGHWFFSIYLILPASVLLGVKRGRRMDNLTVICEPIV